MKRPGKARPALVAALAPALAPILAALTLAGCALSEPVLRPEVTVPASWSEAPPHTGADAVLTADWWRSFDADALDALIAEALQSSPDLRVRAERVIQAELALRSAGAALFPSLALGGSSASQRRDGNEARSTSVSLGASYELDLWGRIAASVDAARAGVEASRFDHDAARLSMAAAVANTWFACLALSERIDIAQRNVDIAENVLRVVDARYRNGAASALDLSQQRSTVLAQRALIEPLAVQLRQTRSALAILLGRTPYDLPTSADRLASLSLPAIDAGLPSALLLRRPDLAASEARLQAAAANIATARAALLPAFSLSASGGLASAALFSLADPTHTVALSAAVMQSIFDGGRLASQVEVQRSVQRELVETHRLTILTALKEVEDALADGARDAGQEALQGEIRAEAQRSLRLAELRYREGADSLLAVLDAQRNLFTAEDALARLRLARLNDAVALYKALGGGWSATGE